MVFDSLAAFVLLAACVSAWALAGEARAGIRLNLRFAAVLLAALPVASGVTLAFPRYSVLALAVALIVAPLASSLLALSLTGFLARPLPPGVSALALGLSLAAGLAGALSGAPAPGVICQCIGAGLILAAGVNAFAGGVPRAGLSLLCATALLCAGFALMAGAGVVTELFFAAALIAAASQMRVEAQRENKILAAITRR